MYIDSVYGCYMTCILIRYMGAIYMYIDCVYSGADPGGGAHPARPPLKLEKIRFFGTKS